MILIVFQQMCISKKFSLLLNKSPHPLLDTCSASCRPRRLQGALLSS